MIRLHNMNRTHTFIDVESGQFISLPKDETDKPPVNADVNGLQFFGKSTQDGEPSSENPVDPVNIPPEFNQTVCGKNLFNKETRTLSMWIARYGNMGSSEISDTTDYIRVEPNTNYFLSGHPNYISQEIAFYDINKTIITELEGIRVASDNGLKTTPANCYFIRFSMAKTDVATVQFEKGSVATPYQPYQGSTYPYRLEDLDGTLHELCSLPDGTRDEYDRDNGILIKPIVKLFASQASEKYIAQTDIPSGWVDVLCRIGLRFLGYEYPGILRWRSGYSNMFKTESWVYGPYTMEIRHRESDIRIDLFIPKADIGITFGGDETEEYRTQKMNAWLNAHSDLYFLTALPEPQIIPIKQYGKTYNGQVWLYNQKPKSIQYHTNIFTDNDIDIQCEVRKLGNRAMGTFNWVTENGDYIVTDDNDYIMLEY